MASIQVTYTGKANIQTVLDCALYAQKDRGLAKFWRHMAEIARNSAGRSRRNRYARGCERTSAQWHDRAILYAAGHPVTYRKPRNRAV